MTAAAPSGIEPAARARVVPAHDVHEFRPKTMRYCLCVFVLNESERIRSQLERMKPYSDTVDIIVADGGSTDGCVDEEVVRPLGVNTILVKHGPGGLSAQMRMALTFALDRGYDGMVVMDGNDKDDPEAIPRFLQAMHDGYDHVQGSRFIPGGKHVNTPLARTLAVRWLHAPVISQAAGFRYTDTTNGFRAYSGKFLLDPRIDPFREKFSRYELHYYLAIRAARLGFRVKEIPVTRRYPSHGQVPTKISAISGNWLMLTTLFRAYLDRRKP